MLSLISDNLALNPTQSKALNATEITTLLFSFGLVLLPFMPQGWF